VRAGLDRPTVTGAGNIGIAGAVATALAQNAPITVINRSVGRHAFEAADNDDTTRAVIEQTIDFVKRAAAPGYQPHFARGSPRRRLRHMS
jgi:shikimate 5-dehydrogenase